MKKIWHPVWLAAALAVVAGLACGGSSGPSIERERDGVRLTLNADRESYKVGEAVKLTAKAENLRDMDLTYGFVPMTEPALQVRTTNDFVGDQLLNVDDDPAGTSDGEVLAAGEKLESTVDWDQMLALYPTPAQAPAGAYTITASLTVSSAGGVEEMVRLSAAVTITLEGGEPLLPVNEAIEVALTQTGLTAWFAQRLSNGASCLYQPTEGFYFANVQTGAVDEVPGDAYYVAVSNGRPICSPVSAGDEWRVQFLSGIGPSPNSVAVYMDIHTGENPRFEELNPDSQPSPSE